MRSRLLATIGALMLAGTACAQGSSFIGGGGVGGEGSGLDGGGGAGGGAMTTTDAASSSASSASGTSSGGGTCSASPCKLTVPQCGCPSDQECGIANFMPACQAAGSLSLGQSCMGAGECAPGLLCVGGSTGGLCDQFCAFDEDCAATGGICGLALSNGMGGSIANADLCSGDCDLTTNSGCPVTGTGCQLGQEQTGQMRWLTYCAVAGTLGQDAMCDPTLDECGPTFGCLNNGVANLCLEYCDASNLSSCPTCVALTDQSQQPIFVGTIEVGVCE